MQNRGYKLLANMELYKILASILCLLLTHHICINKSHAIIL